MRYLALIFIITLLSLTTFAQTPDENVAENSQTETTSEVKEVKDEKEELEKAKGIALPLKRISALQKFLKEFPESEQKNLALELIVSSRAEIAADKMRLSEVEQGVELFKLAVKEAPTPISDKLFSGVLLQIPTNVFLRGQRVAAFDIAKLIEEKVDTNAKQLLGLATFYLGIEYSTAARQLAEKAIELEPESAVAYQTLALASRIGFNIPKAAENYQKALDLNPDSVVSKRSLAEMKRALGESETAVKLYRELLEKDETDIKAKTGLILSLFDSGNQTEAETEMQKEIEKNPKNVTLLVGAAYWYATKNNGEKAVELAQKALQIEPRYTWGYIALARGYMKQNNPLAAETTLLAARRFGNFPTISYELASAQAAAGFYKEAAEELKNNFKIEDGKIVTTLGGRIEAEGDNFIQLLSLERKAGIFEPNAANDLDNAEKLKSLLEFENKLNTETIDEDDLVTSAENFANGDDDMKTHRNLYVANQLLKKKKALPKAMEFTQAAVSGVNSAVKSASPSSAVLADELYDTRRIARTRGQNVVVPDIPATTLSRIIRGRIEETAGWTLYNQEKYEEALAKLNLAMSILPKDSAWWRSVLWKRGAVFESMEKPKEALDSYIQSYASEIANKQEQSAVKKTVVEALYQRVNGNLDGLKEKLQTAPAKQPIQTNIFTKQPEEDTSKETSQKTNENVPDIVPIAKSDKTSESTSDNDESDKDKPTVVVENTLNSTNDTDNTDNKETSDTETTETKSTDTETKTETLPTPIPVDSDASKKPTETENKTSTDEDTEKPAEKTDEKTDAKKSLFDPIIIDVPRVDVESYTKASEKTDEKKVEKTADTDITKTDTSTDEKVVNSDEPKTSDSNKADETTKEDAKKPSETSKEKKADDKDEEKKTDKSDPSLIDLGATRPRVVLPKEDKETEVSECKISVSQEVVSIINDGGSIGVLIGLEDNKNTKEIKAVSSSPQDIEATLEPDIGAVTGKAFFLIKSISTTKGAFTVTFNTPCGKKDILVKVR